MTKIATISALAIALTLLSCQSNDKPDEDTAGTKADQEAPYFEPGFDYVQQTPDSLRTPEQKELIRKIQKVLIEHVGAENNEMVFRLSEEEFVSRGIPVQYYRLIQKDLVTNNKFFKEHNITNVDSIIKESYGAKNVDSIVKGEKGKLK